MATDLIAGDRAAGSEPRLTNTYSIRKQGDGVMWGGAQRVVFPSSSSLNGHPGRPGKRATGGGARPGARGPGRGPTVVWAQPGCLGAFSCRAPPDFQSVDRSLL